MGGWGETCYFVFTILLFGLTSAPTWGANDQMMSLGEWGGSGVGGVSQMHFPVI